MTASAHMSRLMIFTTILLAGLGTLTGACGKKSKKSHQHTQIKVSYEFNGEARHIKKLEILVRSFEEDKFTSHVFLKDQEGRFGELELTVPPGQYQFGMKLYLDPEDDQAFALSKDGDEFCGFIDGEVIENQLNHIHLAVCTEESQPLPNEGDVEFKVDIHGYKIAYLCKQVRRQVGLTPSNTLDDEFSQLSLRYQIGDSGAVSYRLYLGSEDRFHHVDITNEENNPSAKIYRFQENIADEQLIPRTLTVNLDSNLMMFTLNDIERLMATECERSVMFHEIGIN